MKKYLRLLLLPLCPIYGLVSQLRIELYRSGVFKRKTFPLPTFVIGNLSTGGTGKSPHTMFLADKLSEKYKVAVLSRGYGRSTNGFLMVEADSAVKDVGDEPLMIKNKLPNISVAVCEDRAVGIETLMDRVAPEVVVMDDAYQHLGVKADCYFLLTSYDAPFTHDFLLPAGNLRELRIGADRAHCVVVTKTAEQYLNDSKIRDLYIRSIRRYSSAPVIFSSYKYSENVIDMFGEIKAFDEIRQYNIILVTGIAYPDSLLKYLDKYGVGYVHLAFGDHHNFSEADVQQIYSNLLNLQMNNTVILTTEKDMMRLRDIKHFQYPIYYLPIEVSMTDQDQRVFDSVVEGILKNF